MKKNILLSVFFLLLAIFIVVFGYKAYGYYSMLHSDDPIDPYLRVVDWDATIVRGRDLAIDIGSGSTYAIQEGDIIITRDSSLAFINWPDRSKTRLGSSTRLTVNRMRVARDYSSIEIEMKIEKGKIWSNVIRTIYPGSYFRAKLPEWGIIAGVRGTTFDINLDLSYIRSVDHSITLSDNLGHVVSLLPWEAVNARNILEKISSTLRDRLWIEINSTADKADLFIRTTGIEQRMENLYREQTSFMEQIVRYILSWFSAFDGLRVIEILENNNIQELSKIPEKELLKWYQYFQDKKFVQERESIRTALLDRIKTWADMKDFLEVFARGAIWDSTAFSGMSLKSANILVQEYANTIDSRIKNVLNMVPVNELEFKAKETLRSLLR